MVGVGYRILLCSRFFGPPKWSREFFFPKFKGVPNIWIMDEVFCISIQQIQVGRSVICKFCYLELLGLFVGIVF